jgi:phospholysine phosphohistidine inorganic pyrophosphate phosphatase
MSVHPELVMLDLDGTVYQDGQALPGAIQALDRLARAGIELVFLTNTTTVPRSAIVERLLSMGLALRPEQVRTPLAFAREMLLAAGVRRVRALIRPAAAEDLAGLELIPPDRIAEPAEAVLVADMGSHWTYGPLDLAFRDLKAGARFYSCQANRYFRKGSHLVLDAGAFVAALEYAAERPAILVGKPSPDFFLASARERWPREEDLRQALDRGLVCMVGDDLEYDVLAARRAGLHSLLVRTGKYLPGSEGPAGLPPEAVVDSVARLPEHWLLPSC